MNCPQCGSDATRWTGTLGALDWHSCRYCGTEYATASTSTNLDENGDDLGPYPDDEQARHEAEDDYLATCYGYQASLHDESTRDEER